MDSSTPNIRDLPFGDQMRIFRMMCLSTADKDHINPTCFFKLEALEGVSTQRRSQHGASQPTVEDANSPAEMDFFSFVQRVSMFKLGLPHRANGLRLDPYIRLLEALASDEEDTQFELWPEEKLVSTDLKEAVRLGPFYASFSHAMKVINDYEDGGDEEAPDSTQQDSVIARTVRLRQAKSELPGLLTAFLTGKQAVRNLRVDVFHAEQQAMYTSQGEAGSARNALTEAKAELARAEEAQLKLHAKSFKRLFRCLVAVTDDWAFRHISPLVADSPVELVDPGRLAMRDLPFMASDNDELSEIIAGAICYDIEALCEREKQLEEIATKKEAKQKEGEGQVNTGTTEQGPVALSPNTDGHAEDLDSSLNPEFAGPSSAGLSRPLVSNNPFLTPAEKAGEAHDGDDSIFGPDGDAVYDDADSVYDDADDSLTRPLLGDEKSYVCQSPSDQPGYRGSKNPFRAQSFGTVDAEADRAIIGAPPSEYSSSPFGHDGRNFVVVSDGEPLTQSVLNAAEGSMHETDTENADTKSVKSSTSSATPTPTVIAQAPEQPEAAEPPVTEGAIFGDAVELPPAQQESAVDSSQAGEGVTMQEAVLVVKPVEKQEQSQGQPLELAPQSTGPTPAPSSQDDDNSKKEVAQEPVDRDLEGFDVVDDFEPVGKGKAIC